MIFKQTTSVTLDIQTVETAKKWAKVEHVQLSSYINTALEMRNKWHEREEAKQIKAENRITIKEAMDALRKCGQYNASAEQEQLDLENVMKIAKEMWGVKE